tara:strand:+ start:71 stop:214 length:144 start_codon:yes stop_codon:yes gene_type:complete
MALWQSRASPTLTPYLKLTSERASRQASERAEIKPTSLLILQMMKKK